MNRSPELATPKHKVPEAEAATRDSGHSTWTSADRSAREALQLSPSMDSAAGTSASDDEVAAPVALATSPEASQGAEAVNPFHLVKPQLCSEEDEIRKGIFSRALRCLATASESQRAEWQRQIEALLEAKATGAPRKVKELPADSAPLAKRDHVTIDESKGTGDALAEGSDESRGSLSVQKRPRETSEAVELPSASSTCASAVPHPTKPMDFIAAYLRTLLNRVIGLSMSVLPVPALRALCLLVGYQTTSVRKEVLYNQLASFHYTHCAKLGKRVSRTDEMQSRLEEERQMLQRLYRKGPTAAKRPSKVRDPIEGAETAAGGQAVSRRGPSGQSEAPRPPTLRKRAPTATAATGKAGAAAAPLRQRRPANRSQEQTTENAKVDEHGMPSLSTASSEYDEDDEEDEAKTADEELVVQLPERVFRKVAYPPRESAVGSLDADWGLPQLERRIASIVQMYDPVTCEVVVKKLTDLGFNRSRAASMEGDTRTVVERILRSFHDRQLIIYDNGIAFSL